MLNFKQIVTFIFVNCFQIINNKNFNFNSNITDHMPVKNYSGTQLWRIYNTKNFNILNQLENQCDGVFWRHGSNYTDLSFEAHQLKLAQTYLRNANLVYDVVMSNIQLLIENDNELLISRTTRAVRKFNWENYQSLDMIYKFIKEMAQSYPNLVTIFNIGKSIQGRMLIVMRITAVIDNGHNDRLWIDGGVHAREWISPASITYIIYNLLSNWKNLPKRLTKKVWYIMPMANPDGYYYSHTKDRLWRKNMRVNLKSRCYGVDLNRNFGFKWGNVGSSKNPCIETYHGIRAFSEPESKAIRRFLRRRRRNLKAFLTFHSYSQIIGYPWGYKKARVKDYKQLEMVALRAATKIKAFSGVHYNVQPINVLGVASGSDDWARGSLGIKFVYTVELRDKGKYGFLLPKSQIIPTATEALIFVKTIAQYI